MGSTYRRGSRGSRKPTQRDEGGASLIEFALILPIFAMLVFGTFSGASAYNQKLSITAAAREATRYGATLAFASPCDTTAKWLGCIEQATVQTATGELKLGTSGRSICVAFVNTTGSGTATASYTWGVNTADGTPTGALSATACDASNVEANEEQVQVVASRSANLQVIAFTMPLTLSGSSLARYERS